MNDIVSVFTQALEGLESFITMIGHRFPKFYNASLYATFQKSNVQQQKSRMWCKGVSIQIYSEFITGLFSRMCDDIQIKNLSNADPEDC
jgi:hypothetical protein